MINDYDLIIQINLRKKYLLSQIRNCKRRNKGNLMFEYNSNKVLLCGGEGQHYQRFQRYNFIFRSFY